LLKLTGDVKVENGKYLVSGCSKYLFSSQYIEFKKYEERDFKINKILNKNYIYLYKIYNNDIRKRKKNKKM
jgi:hypothetical protein